MTTEIQLLPLNQGTPPLSQPPQTAAQTLFATTIGEKSCVEYIVEKKTELKDAKSQFEGQSVAQKLTNPNFWERYSPIIIGGDLLTVGSLGLDGVTTLLSANSDALSNTTMALGMGAGLINIGVGIYCGIQAIKAFHAGNKLQALRYGIDCVTMIFLGIVMSFLAIAPHCASLSAINDWFNEKPWMLSTAFFIASIPTTLEVARRIFRNAISKTDLASQLALPKTITEEESTQRRFEEVLFKASLEAIRESTDAKDLHLRQEVLKKIEQQQELSREERTLACSYAIEALQADMGVEAAIPVFKLLDALQKKQDTKQELTIAKEAIKGWNRIQKIRFAQQMIYLAAFIFSILLITLNLSLELSAGEKFALMIANLIPLVIDTLLPFRRNPHVTVDKVNLADLDKADEIEIQECVVS